MAKKTPQKKHVKKMHTLVEAVPVTVGGAPAESEPTVLVMEEASSHPTPAPAVVMEEITPEQELATLQGEEAVPEHEPAAIHQEEELPKPLPAQTVEQEIIPEIGPGTVDSAELVSEQALARELAMEAISASTVVENISPVPSTPIPVDPALADISIPTPVEHIPLEEEPVTPVAKQQVDASKASGRGEIVKSATLVMLGNLGSSVMGMVRQIVVGSTGPSLSGPFLAALSPAQKFNDFLINGSVSGALIPTFNDYASPEKQHELRRLVYTLVNLVLLIMLISSVGFIFLAPWVMNNFLASGFNSQDKFLSLQFSRIIFFSLIALGPFAVLQAALYARKEFGWAAFATTAYHIGIIIGATFASFVGEHYYGNYGIAFGVILGALGEIALLLPGLYRQGLHYMFVLDVTHPAIRRILKLYGPVAFSFLVSSGFAFLDQHFASSTPCASFMHDKCGEANYSAMMFATTLIQFPGGLVAAALSFAILPTLTAHAREANTEHFKDTLLLGFRLGLLLMIPAMAGLIVLQMPIVGAIFQHKNFDANETILTATALQNYAYQLPFLAIDQLLIVAFYARKNTIIPVAVLMVSVLCYLAVALPFWQTIGMPALAFANTVQNSSHAIILLIILRIVIGPLNIRKMLPTVLKIILATAVMVAIAWGLQTLLGQLSFFAQPSLLSRLIIVVFVGGLASIAYFGLILLLKVEEVALLKGAVLAKLGKK